MVDEIGEIQSVPGTQSQEKYPRVTESLKSADSSTPIKFYRLDIQGSAKELVKETRIANAIMEGVNLLKAWGIKTGNYLPNIEKHEDLPSEKLQVAFGGVEQVYDLLESMSTMRRIFDDDPKNPAKTVTIPSDEVIEEFETRIKKAADEFQDASLTTQQKKTIAIKMLCAEDLQYFLRADLRMILHDIKQPYTGIYGMKRIFERRNSLPLENYQVTREAFYNINNIVDTYILNTIGESELAEDGDQNVEDMTLSQEKLKSIFLSTAKLSFAMEFGNEEALIPNVSFGKLPENINLKLPPGIWEQLVSNLANNSAKAFIDRDIQGKRIFRISGTVIEDNKFVKICIDDNAGGFPEKIVKLGFVQASEEGIHGYEEEIPKIGSDSTMEYAFNEPEGKTKQVQSEGVGIASQTQYFEEHFGAKIVPGNIEYLNPTLSSKKGARITITFPLEELVSQTSEDKTPIAV